MEIFFAAHAPELWSSPENLFTWNPGETNTFCSRGRLGWLTMGQLPPGSLWCLVKAPTGISKDFLVNRSKRDEDEYRPQATPLPWNGWCMPCLSRGRLCAPPQALFPHPAPTEPPWIPPQPPADQYGNWQALSNLTCPVRREYRKQSFSLEWESGGGREEEEQEEDWVTASRASGLYFPPGPNDCGFPKSPTTLSLYLVMGWGQREEAGRAAENTGDWHFQKCWFVSGIQGIISQDRKEA